MSDASESRASAGRSRLSTDPVARVRGELARVHAAPWHGRAAAGASEGPLLWTRLGPAGGASLERAIWPTPYEAETIGEDARRAGPGTRLEVTVPRPADDARLAAVRSLFGWLAAKGIDVVVREGDAEQL